MAHGKNAKQKGNTHPYEYGSRRPGSGMGLGKFTKQFTHKSERRLSKISTRILLNYK